MASAFQPSTLGRCAALTGLSIAPVLVLLFGVWFGIAMQSFCVLVMLNAPFIFLAALIMFFQRISYYRATDDEGALRHIVAAGVVALAYGGVAAWLVFELARFDFPISG